MYREPAQEGHTVATVDEIIEQTRRYREAEPTPEETARRARMGAEIRRLAPKIDTLRGAGVMGARALLREWDTTAEDHVAIAIAVHKLLLGEVVEDLQSYGQTDPTSITILDRLCSYLDNEGWHYSHGTWEDTSSPQYIRGLFAARN